MLCYQFHLFLFFADADKSGCDVVRGGNGSSIALGVFNVLTKDQMNRRRDRDLDILYLY